MATFQPGDAVKVKGWGGVAFRISGPHTESRPSMVDCEGACGSSNSPCWHDEGEAEDVEIEGKWDCHMVGDDKTHVVDEKDMTLLQDTEFCGECGQIGCTHGAMPE